MSTRVPEPCVCGRLSTATVEVLDPSGRVLMSNELCDVHTAEMTSKMIPTFVKGEPAYRVDRHPA